MADVFGQVGGVVGQLMVVVGTDGFEGGGAFGGVLFQNVFLQMDGFLLGSELVCGELRVDCFVTENLLFVVFTILLFFVG